MSNKRKTDAFLAASKHWGESKRTKIESKEPPIDPIEIIEISSEDEVEEKSTSPIRLLYNPSYPDHELSKVNKDTVRIYDLIGSSELQETYQFNFTIDIPFFTSFLDSSFETQQKKLVFISGRQHFEDDIANEQIFRRFNISEIVADIPNRFGTHHTKMMINFFAGDTVEIVIMTCNLAKLDFGGLTQMLWRSGRLPRVRKSRQIPEIGKRFQTDLMNYLNKYNKKQITQLSTRLKEYDFSSVNVELIASTPGTYNMTKETEIYGYGKLYQALSRNSLLVDNQEGQSKYNVLAQASAISYPFSVEKFSTAGIFSHLLCPLIFSQKEEFRLLQPGPESFRSHQKKHNYNPIIVYPTAEEVANSNVGFRCGGAIHFDYSRSFVHKNYYQQAIKPYLHKWNSNGNITSTGREKVMPHVKLYMCDNGDNWSSLNWVYMGSHNLSKQAWGSRKGNKFINSDPSEYQISSYELGVLIYPKPAIQLII
ncbi:Tyrosyl-DNA phosphodiesterase 1 [Spathaspora sp. JA1]|nr:Tyrosyl-DNA phosphodiesterase 1 [Spathaspora sp. JA1]